jgi:hypothetical protein
MFLDKKEYNRGLVKLLTDFYDCPTSRTVSTKKDKKVIVENVCVSLLGTCPPNEFGESLPVEVTVGGFMARCVMLLITEKSKRVFQGTPDAALYVELIDGLKTMKEMKGEVTYDKHALAWIEEWYTGMESPEDEVAESGYYQRKHDLLLKTAIIINVSRDGKLVLQLYDVLSALSILEAIEPLLKKAHEIVMIKPTARDQEFILNMFHHRKHVLHSELVRVCRLRMNRRDFVEALEALVVSKQIERVRQGKEDYWRKIQP